MTDPQYYFPVLQHEERVLEVDVCAYGAAPASIMAAIQAARDGRTVSLVTNSGRLGGLSSSGLGKTDMGDTDGIGGLAREFYQRIAGVYEVGEEWCFEPKVAERVFKEMLDEADIVPRMREFPARVVSDGRRIREVHFESGLVVRARYFIDASYEGDLMAQAGVTYTVGREDNAEYGELLSGVQVRETHQFELPVDPYVVEGNPSSGLLPGINPEPLAPTGSGDKKIQAYNFRICLTRDANRIPFVKPENYDPLEYELLARYFQKGWSEPFRKFDSIRNGKTDTNNHGAVQDIPGRELQTRLEEVGQVLHAQVNADGEPAWESVLV